MSCKGTIQLVSETGLVVKERQFYTFEQAKAIAKRFLDNSLEAAYISISPGWLNRSPNIFTEEKKALVRPPSKYDNIPVYDYQKTIRS